MSDRRDAVRIAASMAVACAIGGAILGGVSRATERYTHAADLAREQRAITTLLDLDSTATVTEVSQFLTQDRGTVVYEARPFGAGDVEPSKRLAFSLDGQLVSDGDGGGAPEGKMIPVGRLFVAQKGGEMEGFVVEGNVRGYKNRIRFLVALTRTFDIAGVRVLEHEEDPGLGAEVATPWFQGQFVGRSAEEIPSLDVTRDPMPENWRVALLELARMPRAEWDEKNGALAAREREKPIYAVTGATISSRALTDGVRATVDHFRRRWALLAPYLGTPA